MSSRRRITGIQVQDHWYNAPRMRQRLGERARFLALASVALYFAVSSLVRPGAACLVVVAPAVLGAAGLYRAREALVVWGSLAVFLDAFARLRSLAPRTGIPIQRVAFLHADQALFGGTVPTVWLQTHLRVPGRSQFVDYAAVAMHWSHFVAPVATLFILWLVRPALFRRYALAFMLLTALVLGCYFLCPAMPPWLAAREGLLPQLARPVVLVGAALNHDLFGGVYATIGSTNDVAAMPSLHAAYPFLMAAMFWPLSRRLGIACFAYFVLMSAALVYLAEHYVIDLLASVPAVLVAVRIAGILDAHLPLLPERWPARVPACHCGADPTAASV